MVQEKYIVKNRQIHFLSNFNGRIGPYHNVMKNVDTVVFDVDCVSGNYSVFNQLIVLTRNI